MPNLKRYRAVNRNVIEEDSNGLLVMHDDVEDYYKAELEKRFKVIDEKLELILALLTPEEIEKHGVEK
jgi:hypothetical protein